MQRDEAKVSRNTQRWQTIIASIILLILGILLVWGIGKIWFLFWDYISHSQPTIGAAIIATSGTILVSVLSVVLTRWLERNKELTLRRQEIEQEIRKQHIPTYQELVHFLFKIFQASKTGVLLSEEEINTFFTEFTQKILVWGSDRFIKDFSTFREALVHYGQQQKNKSADPDETAKIMLALENLLYSIRFDCGHENKGLGKGDLLTLFINDVRDYIVKEQSPSHRGINH